MEGARSRKEMFAHGNFNSAPWNDSATPAVIVDLVLYEASTANRAIGRPKRTFNNSRFTSKKVEFQP
jgi:hypothetical protein